jgi:hypothetical protein
MDFNQHKTCRLSLAISGFLALVQASQAQPFTWQDGDVALGFRKSSPQGNHELVVNIGAATNYARLTIGTSVTISNFTPAQLRESFPTFNSLSWSATAGGGGSVAGYPNNSLWLTVPRTDPNVPSPNPMRQTYAIQQTVLVQVQSILLGAAYLSSVIGTSNQNNNLVLVQEPINDESDLSAFISGKTDATVGTLRGTLWYDNAEITTPTSFTSPVRSDFYEIRPNGFPDPHTGANSGPAYYLGYFEFATNGAMTFTRAEATTPPVSPPAPQPTIHLAGNGVTISFATTNGATYSLYYTNLAGILAPVTTWATGPSTVTGDGTTKSFTDQSTDPNRIYRVGAR